MKPEEAGLPPGAEALNSPVGAHAQDDGQLVGAGLSLEPLDLIDDLSIQDVWVG